MVLAPKETHLAAKGVGVAFRVNSDGEEDAFG